jgi:hypothetical protein
MKLQRLDEYITTATAVIVGVGVAYWCGLLAGGGQIGTLLSVLGGILFTAVLLGLREQVWMLIPVMWVFSGQLPEVKLNPALRDVVVAGVGVATFMLVAFKVVRRRPVFGALDFWAWLALLYLATVFIRNPTGGLILQSDRIGGRGYLYAAVGAAAYWVLARARIPTVAQVHGFLFALVGFRICNGLMSLFANFVPSVIPFITRFYTGIDTSAFDQSPTMNRGDSVERRGYLIDIGEPVVRWQIAKYRPFDIVNPLLALVTPGNFFRALFFAAGILLVLFTGFRSAMVAIFAWFALSSAWCCSWWCKARFSPCRWWRSGPSPFCPGAGMRSRWRTRAARPNGAFTCGSRCSRATSTSRTAGSATASASACATINS